MPSIWSLMSIIKIHFFIYRHRRQMIKRRKTLSIRSMLDPMRLNTDNELVRYRAVLRTKRILIISFRHSIVIIEKCYFT